MHTSVELIEDAAGDFLGFGDISCKQGLSLESGIMNDTNTILPSCWQDPPAIYRPVPLWTWNDQLEPDELRRQVRLFAENGYGGFFMHARIGLKTPYLGEQWFRCVKLATEEAKRLGIKAWIYDEERWPSGFAGGKIAESDLNYAGHGLACREAQGTHTFEVVRSKASKWLNGASDPDLLNPAVTEQFLQLTHAQYAAHIGDHFGDTTPGSFCDEPSYVQWGRDDKFDLVPWTPNLEAEFERRRGYTLTPHRASLFSDEGDFRKVRVDFYRTVTEMLVAGFAQPIYDWCARHGIASVGHMMMEDTLLHQVRATGAVMPNYEYFHIPGIDYLGDALSWPVLQKQCDSVVHQLGHERMICEAYGAAGWESSLVKLKPVADLLLALGSNLMCQHMALYSIRGCRKHDYPPSAFFQLPGFPLYKAFNDYQGRLSYLLTRGTPVRRIVMLHPIQSAWALYSPGNTQQVEALDTRFAALSRRLLELQRDYDYADELILEKHGRVAAGRLVIGRAAYQAVVMPAAETWSGQTLALLLEFVAQGGTVAAVEPVARFVDGAPSPVLDRFLNQPGVTRVAEAAPDAIDAALSGIPRDVLVTDEQGQRVTTLVHMHRTCGERELFFLTFGTHDQAFQATVELEGEGRVELWDAETGAQTALPAVTAQGRTTVSLEIPACASRLLVLDRGQPAGTVVACRTVREATPLVGPWTVTRLDPNVYVLDKAELKLDQSPWSAPMRITGTALSACTSVPNISDSIAACIANGVQPRDVKTWVRFRFHLNGERAAAAPSWLVLDGEREFSDIRVNGQAVAMDHDAWWLDRGFRKVALQGALQPGANEIQCRLHWVKPFEDGTTRTMPDGTEPDTCFLLGEFSVDWDGHSGMSLAEARQLPADPAADLTRDGLAFYAGRVRYETTLRIAAFDPARRYVLRLAKPHGEGVRLSINGAFVKDLWGLPFEADCTTFLRPGDNGIQIDLFSTLGNTLGHFHHQAPWLDPGHGSDRFFLQPFGLGGNPGLQVTIVDGAS